MMQVAVLGLGSIGLRHALNLLDLGCSVTGFDPNTGRCEMLKQAGGEISDDRAAALEGARAAVIASPNRFHRDDMGAAISAGCSVLVEKPFAHSPQGVRELLERAEAEGLIVAAAHNLRYHPAACLVREMILDGSLGDILWANFICGSYLPDWRPQEDYRTGYAADPATGGVIFDIVHEFDLAMFLLGPLTPDNVSARRSGTLELDSEDCVELLLRHENGAHVTLHLDYITRPPVRYSILAGTRGHLKLDLLARKVYFSPADGSAVTKQEFDGGFDEDYRTEIQDFLRCVRDGSAPACTGREALAVLTQLVRAREMAGLPAAP